MSDTTVGNPISFDLSSPETTLATARAAMNALRQGHLQSTFAVLLTKDGQKFFMPDADVPLLRKIVDHTRAVAFLYVLHAWVLDRRELGDMLPRWKGRVSAHPQAGKTVVVLAAHADSRERFAWAAREAENGGLSDFAALEWSGMSEEMAELLHVFEPDHPWRHGVPFTGWSAILFDSLGRVTQAYAVRPHSPTCMTNHGLSRWWLVPEAERRSGHVAALLDLGYVEVDLSKLAAQPGAEPIIMAISHLDIESPIPLVYGGAPRDMDEFSKLEGTIVPVRPSVVAMGPVPLKKDAPMREGWLAL